MIRASTEARAAGGRAAGGRNQSGAMKRNLLLLIAAAALALTAAAFWLRLVSLERHTGYFSPAFSPDASVLVVERRTRGIAWGLGWEGFTPPAFAHAFSDEVRLLRLSLDGRKVEELERWKSTPMAGRTLREYRGRLFGLLAAGLRTGADASVEYGLELALPRIPAAEVYQLRGVWSLAAAQRQRGTWVPSQRRTVGASEPVIVGEKELFSLPGAKGFPSAVVVLDHARRMASVVIAAADYDARYPNGPAIEQLMTMSRKAAHDRAQAIARIRKEREAAYLSQGMLPNDAALKAWRDVRDLGYLPTPPRWVARRIEAAEVAAARALPRFDIDEMEFKVGLMRDIAEAIAQPGVEVDKDGTRYITHRDYPNAANLNAALESGATEIVIGYRGQAFRLQLLPRQKAAR